MKEGWQIKKLDEVCSFMAGYTPKSDDLSTFGKYPYFKVSDMNKEENEVYLRQTDLYVTSPSKIIPKGAIVFPKNGGAIHTNKKRILLQDSVVDLNTEAVVGNNGIDTLYLFKWFLSINLSEYDKGGGLPSLNISQLKTANIPIPSLSEQERLVGILDREFERIEAIKANAQQALQSAKDLLLTKIDEELTLSHVAEKELGNICLLKGGKRVPKGYSLEAENTGHPYIRVADFNENGTVDASKVMYISKKVYETIKRYTITHKDVYISIAGTIGKSGIIPQELDGANLTENACKLVLNKDVLGKFVVYCTKSTSFKDQVAQCIRQATQPKLALTRLATITIKLPSLSEQEAIVSRLDAVSATCKEIERNSQEIITQCEALKQSLLRKAFEGEL